MDFNESLLYRGEDYKINDNIIIHHPTVGEIFDNGEKEYWNMVNLLCASPADCKHDIFDILGKYFDQIDDFEWFRSLYTLLNKEKTKILFGDFDFCSLAEGLNHKTEEIVLFNKQTYAVVDKYVYSVMVEFVRKINWIKRNSEIPGNDVTRIFMIEESRENVQINANKPFKSTLTPLISFLINSEESKCDYKTVWDFPIYVFLDSVKRILNNKHIGYKMFGIYTGNIDMKKLNKKELDLTAELE